MRMHLQKTWHGDLEGSGSGTMVAAGDPGAGEAAYVAIERVDGTLDGRTGSFAFVQLGTMHGGSQSLHYVVAPGTGTGGLAGITGVLVLTIDQRGHTWELDYELPDA